MLSCPRSVSVGGRGLGEALRASSILGSKERTMLIQKKKKNFFSETPVGKFELPTAPQGHLELAVEPFLWISVKF